MSVRRGDACIAPTVALLLGLTSLAQAQPLETRSICTLDDTREARCYESLEPTAYQRSRAVARLTILRVTGPLYCTGWLVGDEGHLLTAGHCIPNSVDAAATTVELGAEGLSCATDCRTPGACPGTVVAVGVTLLHTNPDLDYSLVKLSSNPAPGYGFLQLRASGPELGERVYMAQHPGGQGKRIQLESSYPSDLDGFPHVTSLTEQDCSLTGQQSHIGTYLDTIPGVSGSPILGYADHRVVALHGCRALLHCATGLPGSDSPNRALPVTEIVDDLGTMLPLSALFEPLFADGFEGADVGVWTACFGAGCPP